MGNGLLEQIPSKACGCRDCIIDFPPAQYGNRPPQDGCLGQWRLVWRDGGKRRSKLFGTRRDALAFSAQVRAGVTGSGA